MKSFRVYRVYEQRKAAIKIDLTLSVLSFNVIFKKLTWQYPRLWFLEKKDGVLFLMIKGCWYSLLVCTAWLTMQMPSNFKTLASTLPITFTFTLHNKTEAKQLHKLTLNSISSLYCWCAGSHALQCPDSTACILSAHEKQGDHTLSLRQQGSYTD